MRASSSSVDLAGIRADGVAFATPWLPEAQVCTTSKRGHSDAACRSGNVKWPTPCKDLRTGELPATTVLLASCPQSFEQGEAASRYCLRWDASVGFMAVAQCRPQKEPCPGIPFRPKAKCRLDTALTLRRFRSPRVTAGSRPVGRRPGHPRDHLELSSLHARGVVRLDVSPRVDTPALQRASQ